MDTEGKYVLSHVDEVSVEKRRNVKSYVPPSWVLNASTCWTTWMRWETCTLIFSLTFLLFESYVCMFSASTCWAMWMRWEICTLIFSHLLSAVTSCNVLLSHHALSLERVCAAHHTHLHTLLHRWWMTCCTKTSCSTSPLLSFSHTHTTHKHTQVVDDMLHKDFLFDIALPRLPARCAAHNNIT